MERSRLLRTLSYPMRAMSAVSVPVEAKTAVETVAAQAPADEVSYRLIDFLTLELILLGGLVLLGFVFVARKSKAR